MLAKGKMTEKRTSEGEAKCCVVHDLAFISEVDMVWLPSASKVSKTSRAFLLDFASFLPSCVIRPGNECVMGDHET